MWVIAKNALRERIRRKELYIVVAVGILILLLCSSGTATIMMNGEPITSFDNMIVVMHTMVAAVGCLLAVVLGIRTIPNEYERKDSHLVWVRGISQPVYHGGLALANILSAMLATGILYFALAVYIVANGRTDYLVRMLPAFLIVCIAVATASLFTSVLSIVFPVAVTGILGILFALGGILHGILDLYKNVAGGVAGTLLKGLLFVLPDMNGIQQQARRLMAQGSVDVHLILTGLLAIYVLSVGIMVFRRREA